MRAARCPSSRRGGRSQAAADPVPARRRRPATRSAAAPSSSSRSRVLGRERVDRGRDDRTGPWSAPVGDVRRAARTRTRPRARRSGWRKRHARVGLVVRLVACRCGSATPRAPRRAQCRRPGRPSAGRAAARSRRAARARERRRGCRRGPLVVLRVLVAERPAVTGLAVQRVVDALGEREELGVAVEHQPAVVDAGAPPVREQRLQHLGHPAAVGGRVDVPDDAVVEERLCLAPRGWRAARPVGLEQAGEPVERDGVDRHLVHAGTLPRLALGKRLLVGRTPGVRLTAWTSASSTRRGAPAGPR